MCYTSQLQVQRKLGLRNAHLNLCNHLHPEDPQSVSHVAHVLNHDLLQQRRQFLQGVVVGVVHPCLYEDPVVGLQLKVFGDVVNYYYFAEISPQLAQILKYKSNISYLDIKRAIPIGVLPIKSMRNIFFLVQRIQDPVSILKNDN